MSSKPTALDELLAMTDYECLSTEQLLARRAAASREVEVLRELAETVGDDGPNFSWATFCERVDAYREWRAEQKEQR